MEKILQEFRIIETDDGFRIEIKGDKEQLRDFVMSLDPRQWMQGGPPEWGPFPFGPRFRMKFKRGFGPFGFAWDCCDDDDESHHRHGRGHGRGHHGPPHRHDHEAEPEEDNV